MKRFLFAGIIFIFSCTCRAQEIELLGTYSASFLGAESITFKGIDSFYFDGFYCTSGVQGRGRCEILDNHLYLYFSTEAAVKVEEKKHEVLQVQTAESKKRIALTCLMDNDEKIGFASIYVKRQNGIETQHTCDSSGYVNIAVDANEFPISIRTSAVGTLSAEINLKEPADHFLKLFHRDAWELINKNLRNGEVYIYEISNLDANRIVMRRPAGRGTFYTYKKSNH